MKLALVYPSVWHGTEDYTLASQSSYDSRVAALQSFVERHSGVAVEIQTPAWRRSGLVRLVRPYTLVRELAQIRPDAVIVQYPNYPFFWSLDRPRDIRRAILFTRLLRKFCDRAHASLVLDYRDPIGVDQVSMPEDLFHRLEEAVFQSPDFIWSPSSDLLDMARDRFCLTRTHLQVVRNGAFAFPAGGQDEQKPVHPRFIYTGDLKPRGRGIEQMLEAIAACPGVDCEFVLCGPNSEWIAQQAKDPRVMLMGEVSRQRATSLVRSSHVGMIPSPNVDPFKHNFPTKLGEFVYAGLAVLCSDAREASEYVTGNGLGISAPFAEWPDAIRQLAEDHSRLQSYRSASAAMSADLLWDNIYDSAYREMQSALGR